MIQAKILKNGTLKITADNQGRADLKEAWNELEYYPTEDFITEELRLQSFEFVRPEWVGALTDSPIITDELGIADDGTADYMGDVWWYPNYMITDPWEELKNKGRVIFTPEENNKSLKGENL